MTSELAKILANVRCFRKWVSSGWRSKRLNAQYAIWGNNGNSGYNPLISNGCAVTAGRFSPISAVTNRSAVTKLLRLMLDERRRVDRLHGPALVQALAQYAGPADLNRHTQLRPLECNGRSGGLDAVVLRR